MGYVELYKFISQFSGGQNGREASQFAGGRNGREAIHCILMNVILLHRLSCTELELIKLPALTVAAT